jgi:hypothetical protein
MLSLTRWDSLISPLPTAFPQRVTWPQNLVITHSCIKFNVPSSEFVEYLCDVRYTTFDFISLFGYWMCRIRHFLSSSSSSVHYSPLLNIRLSNFSPSRSIFGYSHSAPASRHAQIVTPPALRASTFTETRPPLQNSLNPAAVGSTADMASPLPLQHANTVCYVGDFSSLPDHLV